MKNYLVLVLLFISLNCSSNQDSFQIKLNNPVDVEREDQLITLIIDSIKISYPDFNPEGFILLDDENELPYQFVNQNEIIFTVNFAPSEEKIIIIKNTSEKNEYESRVYAEVAMKVDYNFIDGKYSGGRFKNFDSVRVPDNHTDHNALFKYEGPGWESDKVGYRYYIDWRNRIDIFGKKTDELVLKDVGVDDREAKDDSYHQMQKWGMDIYKVGNSFGIGSYGMMLNDSVYMVSERDSVICVISKNGPVKAEVTTDFYGWKAGDNKYNLKSLLSITAGSRFTKADIIVNSNPENIVTGLAKDKLAQFFEKKSDSQWSYIALYGNHSLAEDYLGVALFYNNDKLIDSRETDDSHIILLKPYDEKVTYYFCAAWEKEPDGIKNKEEFISYLDSELQKFNNPVLVEYRF
ncbi:MAG: DUF4861 domain-containing protein [Ignavibacteriales bacterium]|nr:MAG: DUF4861 domain-containing protein [Ignavibacteriales bacterium]